MTSVRELHNEAMRLAQLALIARQHGEHDEAKDIAREAYKHENKAAHLVPEGKSSEPTRSILFRSAASLAHQCGELVEAQRLIAKGLSGYPPPQIEIELKDLYEQVNFELELQSQSIIVEEEEFDLRLRGKAVGFGAILYDEFVERIETVQKLIVRTTQRLMDREYQREGRIADRFKVFVPLLYTPRPGSFSITFKLGRAEDPEQLHLFVDASAIIEEIMTGMELINAGNEEKLRKHINEDAYYQQFLTLTRSIVAPDGEQIRLIQFTSNKRQVNFTRKRSKIPMFFDEPEDTEDEEKEFIEVIGTLNYAESKKNDKIGLTTEDDENYVILVDKGMDDLVLSYWKRQVMVSGYRKGTKSIRLTDIHPVD